MNEPVAWIYDWGDEQDIKTKLFPNSKAKITPLYTHPAKTLTDDAQYDRGFDAGCKHAEKNLQAEIEALKAKTLTDEEILKQIRSAISCYFDDTYSYSDELYYKIEAILRKAQELTINQ